VCVTVPDHEPRAAGEKWAGAASRRPDCVLLCVTVPDHEPRAAGEKWAGAGSRHPALLHLLLHLWPVHRPR